MTRVPTYTLNDPPGVFRVFGLDGSTVFDSSYPTQRIHMTGVASLSGRTIEIVDHAAVVGPAGAFIPYGKTFSTPPYVLAASRKIAADSVQKDAWGDYPDRIFPPYLMYYSGVAYNFYTALKGFITNADVDQLYIANISATGDFDASYHGERIGWYAIFENPVGS